MSDYSRALTLNDDFSAINTNIKNKTEIENIDKLYIKSQFLFTNQNGSYYETFTFFQILNLYICNI